MTCDSFTGRYMEMTQNQIGLAGRARHSVRSAPGERRRIFCMATDLRLKNETKRAESRK